MFTPPPSHDVKLYTCYRVNGEQHCVMPIEEIMSERTLFDGKEFLVLSITASIHYLKFSASSMGTNMYKLHADENATIFLRTVKHYLTHKHKSSVELIANYIVLTEHKSGRRTVIIGK